MASIQRNLDLYRELSEEESQILESEKQFCMECFLQRYKLVPMVHQWRVMKYKKVLLKLIFLTLSEKNLFTIKVAFEIYIVVIIHDMKYGTAF